MHIFYYYSVITVVRNLFVIHLATWEKAYCGIDCRRRRRVSFRVQTNTSAAGHLQQLLLLQITTKRKCNNILCI